MSVAGALSRQTAARRVLREVMELFIGIPFMAMLLLMFAGIPAELASGLIGEKAGIVVHLGLAGAGFFWWLPSAVAETRTDIDRILHPERHAPFTRSTPESYPVVAGTRPLVGWRWWILVPEEGPTPAAPIPVLAGPVTGAPWPGQEMMAECTRGHPLHAGAGALIPALACMCGIYALKEREDPGIGTRGVLVEGRIEMSGRVLEAEHGYRAERARIEGPLWIVLRCSLRTNASTCREKPTHVTIADGRYLATCDGHLLPGDLNQRPAAEFIEDARSWLRARYEIDATAEEVTP